MIEVFRKLQPIRRTRSAQVKVNVAPGVTPGNQVPVTISVSRKGSSEVDLHADSLRFRLGPLTPVAVEAIAGVDDNVGHRGSRSHVASQNRELGNCIALPDTDEETRAVRMRLSIIANQLNDVSASAAMKTIQTAVFSAGSIQPGSSMRSL
jgi:hypothetical protein